MVRTVANSRVPGLAKSLPDYDIQGYGSMCYTPRGYGSGYLPRRVADIFAHLIRRDKYVPTIYSYRTPIAFYDRAVGRWIIPAVSYSVTTGKHQSYLWNLHSIRIPRDCGMSEYERYAAEKMVYAGNGTRPGPNFEGITA